MDPHEDTRPCDCCGAAGVLPQHRYECMCLDCEAAECDPLEETCRKDWERLALEESEENA